jgi:hypothetical protein
MTKHVELTQQEAQQLIDLCDVATKAAGLQAARAALPLVDKLMTAFAATDAAAPSEPAAAKTADPQ